MFACTSADQADLPRQPTCLCCQPQLQFAARRINRDLSRRGFIAGAGASLAALGLFRPGDARAAPPGPTRPVVFVNLLLFDGTSKALRGGLRLLVEGNRIKLIANGDLPTPDGAQVVDCGGRVMMPGLIDAHWHAIFAALPVPALFAADIGYIFLAASAEAERTLMRGFTTVRDLGGPSFALKQAIDDGLATGPRIYPSGAMITTTGGHGDLRPLSDLPRNPGAPSYMERTGAANIADSADEIRLRVREQLLQGASQIKLVGGGGVASPRTTLDMFTFTEPELRAGVEAAADRNTYVAAHAYPPAQIRRAIAAGVRCVEHGHLMDEATAALMAEKNIWLSTQPFVDESDAAPLADNQSRINLRQVIAGTNTVYALAKKHQIKTAFGTDCLFSRAIAERQGIMLTHLSRWYDNADVLKMATSSNAELLAMSGPRNPYQGKLGVIEEGALADLLVIDGNPIEHIELMAEPDKNFMVIMKDGKIYKNTLPSSPRSDRG
jgi:imidazolonepropionase-like amidohydrolase